MSEAQHEIKNAKARVEKNFRRMNFITLQGASEVTFADAAPADVAKMVSVVTHNATAYMPMAELVDIAAELDRINKEIEKAKNGLRIVEQKLSNEKFISRAPEAVVNAEKEKAAKYSELIAKLEESAKAMQA